MRSMLLLLFLSLLTLTAGCSNGGVATEPTGTGLEAGAGTQATNDDTDGDTDDDDADDDADDDDADDDEEDDDDEDDNEDDEGTPP
jgi:hypothetical protein